MRDSVKMVIGSKEISTFLSYEADSNVLIPADAFSCTISRIENSIHAGDKFELYVNGAIEMTGIVDKVTPSYKKGSEEMTIEGRDLMGILVDSSVEEFRTIKDIKLKDLAKRLLKNVPFLDKSKIAYGHEKTDAGLSKPKKVKTESQRYSFGDTSNVCQYEPGISIFEALSDHAQRHGLIMWMEPDGTLIFGELKGNEDPVEFSFFTQKAAENSKSNNILSAKRIYDISKRFSKVTVVAQIQGNDNYEPGEQDIKKPAYDKSFPFYKPLVLQSVCESEKAAGFQAGWELKKRDVEGWRLDLEVAGHSQDKKNYRANRVCYLKDEIFELEGNYLILGRKFTMDRSSGPRTSLTIGKLMEGYSVQ